MRYFPAFFETRGRRCLVVGGGAAAAGKLRLLADSEALVTVVAPAPSADLEALAAGDRHCLLRRPFQAADLIGQGLVFVATGDAGEDALVAAAARRRNIPVNVVDRPALCDFIVPSIIDRDPVVIAVSTAGAAPVLARRLRQQIESWLPVRLGDLARLAAGFRAAVGRTLPDQTARARFWEAALDGPIADRALAGDEQGARRAMLQTLNQAPQPRSEGGLAEITVTSADPEDLRLGDLRLLWRADLVVSDGAIAAPALRAHLRREAVLAEMSDLGSAHPRIAAARQAGQRIVCLRSSAQGGLRSRVAAL